MFDVFSEQCLVGEIGRRVLVSVYRGSRLSVDYSVVAHQYSYSAPLLGSTGLSVGFILWVNEH